MNANQMIQNSILSKIRIEETDKTLDGSKTYADALASVAQAITLIAEALPKMKAAGVDMKKASYDADGLFRNVVRKGWGGSELDFYVTRDGGKAICGLTQQHLDDISDQIRDFVANYS